MTFKLYATLTHKSFPQPLHKEVTYAGNTMDDVLDLLKADRVPPDHLHNLKHHRRASFRDALGVKHQWLLKEIK